jgi:hypothetical protein
MVPPEPLLPVPEDDDEHATTMEQATSGRSDRTVMEPPFYGRGSLTA